MSILARGPAFDDMSSLGKAIELRRAYCQQFGNPPRAITLTPRMLREIKAELSTKAQQSAITSSGGVLMGMSIMLGGPRSLMRVY